MRLFPPLLKQKTVMLLFFVNLSLLYACKQEVFIDKSLNETESSNLSPDDYSISEYAYNVNIIYLIPKDRDTIAGYKERLSELFLWSQNWTKDEMNRHGYPDKTFGLLLNNQNKVLIQVIRSQYTHAELPYDSSLGGATKAEDEVKAYYAANPTSKASEHTIILYPSLTNGIKATGGTPFYGRGKFCHALDYSLLTLANVKLDNATGTEARKWFGGMIHELFHGLNLPHNSETTADQGVAIMRNHYKYGLDKLILTATDASIFNVNQVFSKVQGTFYGPVTSNLTLTSSSYNAANSTINLAGNVTASNPVNKVIVYVDPHAAGDIAGGVGGVNTDYNAVSFVTNLVNGQFNIAIPTNLLSNFDTTIDHYIRISTIHANGTLSRNLGMYKFNFDSNKVPTINFVRSEIALDKTNWTIASFSSQNISYNEYAANIIDNNTATYWQSRWSTSATSFPHEIVINLGTSQTIKGLTWLHRSQGSKRAVSEAEILVSQDGTNYQSAGTYSIPNLTSKQYLDFPAAVNAKFIKLNMKKGHDGTQYACIAEIEAF